jgi:hypothetical protein
MAFAKLSGLRLIAPLAFLVTAVSVGAASAGPTIEGYLPSHRGLASTLATTGVRPYTDIALSFINPDAQGRFVNGNALACMTDRMLTPISGQALRDAVATIHAGHTRAIGALAGAFIPACAGDWAALTAPPRRAATVAALVALTDAYGLDGLDVDIEDTLLARLVKNGDYTPFVTALGRALHAHHKTLSGTTASYVGGMIPLGALPAFDRVEVMAYDNIVPGEEQASLTQFRSDLYLWLGRGVARDKLVMGLPFYGRGYGSYNQTYTYRDLVAKFGAPSGDLVGQICATCSYVTLNGPATIAQKTALATAKAGGVMVWEISEDTPDAALTRAIENGLVTPPPALAAPVVAMPSLAGPSLVPVQTRTRLGIDDWTVYGSKAYAIVPDDGGFGGKALEVQVAKPTEDDWDVGLATPLTGAVRAGDHLTFALWARLKAADPGTQMDIPLIIEKTAPETPIIESKVILTPQWQWVRVDAVAAADYPAGTLKADLQIGNAAKIIDVSAPLFIDRGPNPNP